MNSVGERIREARMARGLTQDQLARGLATKGFISQVERNRSTPSLPKLRLLAERLGLPLSHFVGETRPQQLSYLRKSAELAIRADEPERALAILDEALTLPSTANERADVDRLRGMALCRLYRAGEALTILHAAAAAAPPDDPELNAAIYTEIGTALQIQERFNAATEANLRAQYWLERARHGDPDLRARILTNLGVVTWALGQIDQSIKYLEQALAAATDAESLFRLANAQMALGITAREQGDLDRALEYCNRALEIHRRIGHEQIANRILNNLGDTHFAAGRMSEARDCQTRCLMRARELNDVLEVGISAGELARYALRESHLEQAVAFARESQAAAEQANDHLHQATSLALEGQALDRLGHQRMADRRFRRSLGILSERQAAGKLAQVCTEYAAVLRERGDVDRAFAFMRMAAERDFKNLPTLLRRRRG